MLAKASSQNATSLLVRMEFWKAVVGQIYPRAKNAVKPHHQLDYAPELRNLMDLLQKSPSLATASDHLQVYRIQLKLSDPAPGSPEPRAGKLKVDPGSHMTIIHCKITHHHDPEKRLICTVWLSPISK
jgi:hypothetical protein